jgi:hypothetical protein
MKRLWDVLAGVLALNFLVIIGLAAWLRGSGRLNRDRIDQIKLVLFPPAAPEAPTTQPSDPTTRPTMILEALLAHKSNLPAGQQVDFVQKTFDQRQYELEQKDQLLGQRQAQLDLVQQKLTDDRTTFEAERKAFQDQQAQAAKLASDAGFQKSLDLYNAMQPKQVKAVFAGLDDDVVKDYFAAMDPLAVKKIIAEFKSPDETARVEKIMEKIRKGEPTSRPING